MAKIQHHKAPFSPYILKEDLENDVEWLRNDMYDMIRQRKEEIATAIKRCKTEEEINRYMLFWDAYTDSYKDFCLAFETRFGYAMRKKEDKEDSGDNYE